MTQKSLSFFWSENVPHMLGGCVANLVWRPMVQLVVSSSRFDSLAIGVSGPGVLLRCDEAWFVLVPEEIRRQNGSHFSDDRERFCFSLVRRFVLRWTIEPVGLASINHGGRHAKQLAGSHCRGDLKCHHGPHRLG